MRLTGLQGYPDNTETKKASTLWTSQYATSTQVTDQYFNWIPGKITV